jgi:hypothetical protein
MKTHPIKSDQRWTVTREHTGAATPQFVIRFCGDWTDARSTYPAAVVRAVVAKATRDGGIVFTEQTTKPNQTTKRP